MRLNCYIFLGKFWKSDRSIRSQMFFKIGVLKSFLKTPFITEHLRWLLIIWINSGSMKACLNSYLNKSLLLVISTLVLTQWLLRCCQNWSWLFVYIVSKYRTSPPEVFLGKDVLKICSKFTGEHLRRSVINKVALKLYWNHTSAWVFCKFAAYFQNTLS